MPDNPRDLNNSRDSNDHPVRANRGIVTVVVILGVLIVLGLGGLVYGIALKAGKLGQPEPEKSETRPVEGASSEISGRRIVGMNVDSGRLYLHVMHEDGRELIQVYNSEGKKLFDVIPFPEE